MKTTIKTESDASDSPEGGRPILDNRIGRLAERLEEALEGRSLRPIADKAGLSEGTLRNLLGGGVPRLDSLLRIADTLGVSFSWLATGEGQKRPEGDKEMGTVVHSRRLKEENPLYSIKLERETSPSKLDIDALREAVLMVLESGDGSPAGRGHDRSAALIAICYQALLAGMSSDLMHEILAVSMRQPD